jgi:serine/threonine protein kinase
LEIFETESTVYLVLEFAERGTLLGNLAALPQGVGSYTEAESRIILEQLLLTLHYIHDKGIIHRDFKIDNVLVMSEERGLNGERELYVKVADFGFSTHNYHYEEAPSLSNLEQDLCGTPSYMAPEILRKEGYYQKCDVFSLGSLLYNLLTGEYLFVGRDQQEIMSSN